MIFGVMLLIGQATVTLAATPVHDFCLPMLEAQIRQTLTALESGFGMNLDTVFSVVLAGHATLGPAISGAMPEFRFGLQRTMKCEVSS